MAKFRIRSGDTVQVITGKDKGKTGRVLRVMPDKEQVVIEGIRRVKRHQKPTGDQPGAIVQKEMPLSVSNVALWDAENNARIKVAWQEVDGKKVRVNRKTGAVIDQA
jgi:large subunit ribosomal protein L24